MDPRIKLVDTVIEKLINITSLEKIQSILYEYYYENIENLSNDKLIDLNIELDNTIKIVDIPI